MRNRFVCVLFLMALLGSSAGLEAQNRPDFSGIWTRTGRKANENFGKGAPPLQLWAKALYDENRTGLKPDEDGLDAMDPTIYCMPHGIPRVKLRCMVTMPIADRFVAFLLVGRP